MMRSKRHPLRRHVLLSTRWAALLSLIVSGSSITFSLSTGDWNWFARSGSLVVIIGIFLTSTQVIENSSRLRSRRTHHLKNFDRDYAEESRKESLSRFRILDEDLWENGLRGFYLLVIGTLIWGYGDLIGHIVSF